MTIKNGDLPAMPQTNGDNLCMMTGTPKQMHAGLTKREMFAMAAMQGLLVNMHERVDDIYNLSKYATMSADALLAELERTK